MIRNVKIMKFVKGTQSGLAIYPSLRHETPHGTKSKTAACRYYVNFDGAARNNSAGLSNFTPYAREYGIFSIATLRHPRKALPVVHDADSKRNEGSMIGIA